MRYPVNHYILILKHNYTGKLTAHDIYNKSNHNGEYEFEFEWPEDSLPGEYTYALIWTYLNYQIDLSDPIEESILTVTDDSGDKFTYKLKDIGYDTGIILFAGKDNISYEEYYDIDR